jgi:hypothetical protein
MEITDTNATRKGFCIFNLCEVTSPMQPKPGGQLIEDIEKVQRRATKHILNLGFITDISYKTRLLQLDISPVSYWHEYLDLVFLYKIINNLTYIDERALPIMAGSGITRSESNANLIRFVIPYAKTVTFQTSFFIRTCKTWNILNSNLRTRDIGSLSFKSGLKLYYKHALSKTFKCGDSRTWKSVCVKCKRARSLNNVISCC